MTMPSLYEVNSVHVAAHWYNFTPQDRDRGDLRAELFKPLEFKESRNRSLWMSVVVHGVLLSLLLAIPLLFTDTIKIRYRMVALMAPPMQRQVLEVTNYKQPPRLKAEPRPEKPSAVHPPVKLLIQPPEVRPEAKIAAVKLPEVIERENPAPVLRNTLRLDAADPAIAAPKIEARTGAFESSAKPSTSLPAREVQTGGFGDPNGIKGEGKPGKIATIASLGSFDLPVGPGSGNGTGGTHGMRGTVASTGFGNGLLPGGNGGSGGGAMGKPEKAVRQGGFGDSDTAKPEASKRHADVGPLQTPVEILFKPKPEYTDEARKLKLEGEVLVRVLFTAAGEVRLLDVLRGLGHGLDETATLAAQQIKFRPAQRNGQPVDSTATVHIVFQLAY
jgi:TonB family protein